MTAPAHIRGSRWGVDVTITLSQRADREDVKTAVSVLREWYAADWSHYSECRDGRRIVLHGSAFVPEYEKPVSLHENLVWHVRRAFPDARVATCWRFANYAERPTFLTEAGVRFVRRIA